VADSETTIGFKDLYLAHQEGIKELTAAINGVKEAIALMTGHLETIDARNRNADQEHVDFETRLRALERFRYALPTSVVVSIGTAIAAIAEWLSVHH
jgi:hypothetical protein